MATEFKLPELGEGVEAADVVNVLVAKGDTVSKGQTVLEVESDKATVEVPSEVEGEVVELHISPGDTVTVGQLLLTVADGAPTEDSAPQPAPKPASASKSAASRASKSAASSGGGLIPFHVPELGEGVEGADIVSVLVAEGDPIEEGQSVLEVESDKATVEVPSSVAGVVKRLAVKAGETITVGQLVLEVEGSDAAATATPAPEEAPDAPAASSAKEERPAQIVDGRVGPGRPVFAAPSVRMLARKNGIDIRDVTGSGPAGRIGKEDVEAHLASRGAPSSEAPDQAAPAEASGAEGRIEKLSRTRRVIAERMAHSWQTIPHVILNREADVTELETYRKRFKDAAEDGPAKKLTMTAILVKVCAMGLGRFPRVNASLDLDNDQIVYHSQINVGVAADTERGLVVPVVRDAPTKSQVEIAGELSELAVKARDGKLSREDMSGGTFSISNLGGFGVGHFTAIINPPEVAILAVGRGKKNGAGRFILPLSLSIDHRILDGADGARFLAYVVDCLEDPGRIIFEG